MSHETTNQTPQCGCRRDCEAGARNNYYDRKPLTPLSFQIEQDYGIKRRRLLNRAIHGWGVVYGYSIKPGKEGEGPALSIGKGLALDQYGRELMYPGGPIRADELILLEGSADGDQSNQSGEKTERWLLCAHYAEKSAGPVMIRDSCRHEWTEWDQTCETVRFSVKPVQSKGDSQGQSSDCSEAEKEQAAKHPECETPDQLLCEHLANLCIKDDPGRLRLQQRDEPDGPVFVDLKQGVPLACLEMTRDDCDRLTLESIDACAPRRLVKRNDLLFDLIQARDLTHISGIGWKDWHENPNEISFVDFSAALGARKAGDDPCAPRFDIVFSAPVHPPTRDEDCFAMTILVPGEEGGWWRSLRAPITKVLWSGAEGASGGPYNRASLIFDADWVQEAVLGRYTLFHNRLTRIEIEIRGDLILDCHGRAVDANAIGRNAPPTGNGTPGGVFLSTFHVGPAKSQTQESAEESGS